MAELWPADVLRPQNVAWNIAPRSLRGPTSVSGVTQVVASDAGIWKATFSNVVIRSREEVLTFRKIATQLEGMLYPILVPRCGDYQPKPPGGRGGVPHSDGAYFSDRSGYVIGPAINVGGEPPVASTMEAKPARATSIKIAVYVPVTIEPGQDFSIGERMYRIKSVTYSNPTTATIEFRPPLRESVPAFAGVEFNHPVCRMRLATDSEMDLDLQLRRFGSPTVSFIEDI